MSTRKRVLYFILIAAGWFMLLSFFTDGHGSAVEQAKVLHNKWLASALFLGAVCIFLKNKNKAKSGN